MQPIIMHVDNDEPAPPGLSDEAVRKGYKYQVRIDEGEWTMMTESEYQKYKAENPGTSLGGYAVWTALFVAVIAGIVFGCVKFIEYLD